MIPSREDRLVRYAFGDVSDHERAEVEALIARDPEARRTVDQYASMRDDLGRMREVPEDQMSRERLRDAILARGLRTDPIPASRSRWQWLWMPVAACALAFVYVAIPHPAPTASEPTYVAAADRHPNIDFGPSISMPVKTDKAVPVKMAVVSEKTPPSKPKVRPRHPHREPESIPFDKTSLVASVAQEPREVEPKPIDGALARNDPHEPEILPSTTTSRKPGNDAPIVIVEPSPDSGPNAAQEVDSVSNVLVGG